MALLAFVLMCTILFLYGTALIANGVLLGLLTFLGLLAIALRIPKLAKMVKKFPLCSEIGAAGFTYAFLGGSVTGLIAAAVVGLGVSASVGY